MLKEIHLSTLVWGVFIILAVLLLIEGTHITTGLFKPCGTVVTVMGFALLLFDKWAWKFRWLHPWFVDRPYLKGTWKGTLVSSYVNPQTGQPVLPIQVYLVVRQIYSAIHLRLMTCESASESLANNIRKDEDGVYTIASVYRNTPQQTRRHNSPIHHGAMLLQVVGDPVAKLSGEYWTDRQTHGEVNFDEKTDMVHYDFASAAAGTFKKLAVGTVASVIESPATPASTTPPTI